MAASLNWAALQHRPGTSAGVSEPVEKSFADEADAGEAGDADGIDESITEPPAYQDARE
jgi:hypothetical protein